MKCKDYRKDFTTIIFAKSAQAAYMKVVLHFIGRVAS